MIGAVQRKCSAHVVWTHVLTFETAKNQRLGRVLGKFDSGFTSPVCFEGVLWQFFAVPKYRRCQCKTAGQHSVPFDSRQHKMATCIAELREGCVQDGTASAELRTTTENNKNPPCTGRRACDSAREHTGGPRRRHGPITTATTKKNRDTSTPAPDTLRRFCHSVFHFACTLHPTYYWT